MDSTGTALDRTTRRVPRVVPEAEWQALAERHERAVRPWVEAYRDRRARAKSHPVHDFLFTYYQTNRRALTDWRPSLDMVLAGHSSRRFLDDERYQETSGGVRLDVSRLDQGSRRRAEWVASLMRAGMQRAPRFNCFGLHEWAMVYKADEIRHETTPLRLKPSEVAEVVEANVIRCTHFDAYRFFTVDAIDRNQLKPGRDDRLQFEQFGCVHFNMDLYKWSIKLAPWSGADLVRQCFELAIQARALDMRASPYDLSEYGYEAIRIETAEGRETYRKLQSELFEAGQPLARALLRDCEILLSDPRNDRGGAD